MLTPKLLTQLNRCWLVYRSPFASAAAAPLIIFLNSYSFVNSRLKISRFPTRSLHDWTSTSRGLTSPFVCMRSSNVAKRGCGTVSRISPASKTTSNVGSHTLVSCEHNATILQKLCAQHVGQGVVLFVECENRTTWSSCNVSVHHPTDQIRMFRTGIRLLGNLPLSFS